MSILAEAQQILRAFEFDRKRTNALAGRTLMTLAQVDTNTPWGQATSHRVGVRGLMDWMRDRLDHPIAENTRESIRRDVLHQFIDVGFCLHNDDEPNRPTNSSHNNYRLSDEVILVIRMFGTPNFSDAVEEYLADAPGLAKKYASARRLARLPIQMPDGTEITLKEGGQNDLIKAMIEDFCAYFAPGSQILYVGDADAKLLIHNKPQLAALNITLDKHGKFPDLIAYQPKTNWLFLMEACSTHGPVDNTRYHQLTEIFGDSSAELVFVSCFPDRNVMRKFFPDLAWETEAWMASEPTHLIHLNGAKFLGPHRPDSLPNN